MDYEAPVQRAPASANVTLYNDHLTTFKQKATPKVEAEESGAIASSGNGGEPVFKKRKIKGEHRKNFRRRGDDE